MRFLPIAILCALLPALACADVRLPALFGDHMVIQRDRPIHIWGWADPDERVRVAFRGQLLTTSASSNGRFSLYLEPADAGGPHDLLIEGTNTIHLSDVLVGDVWVGSGQSNMDWPLESCANAAEEIAQAQHPGIRYFKVVRNASDTPQKDIAGEWRVVTPQTAGEFSGLGYFFARHLHHELGVPLAVLQSAWGGTPAQAWTSARTLMREPELADYVAQFEATRQLQKPAYEAALAQWEKEEAEGAAAQKPPRPRNLNPSQTPAWLFNGMIAPLTPFPIRGVIWYQGENNANNREAHLYRRLFRALIEGWRREWQQGAFPFLFVQLTNYARVSEDSMWPELREAQAMALALKNTGMVVTIDIGDSTDIHPRNKQDAGLRLALAARAIEYGEHDLEFSGPAFRQVTKEDAALRLWFDHADSGLVARGESLRGFEIAGPDGAFVDASARIEGQSVLLTHPSIEAPAQARYAWAADPDGNLMNAAGLPASPFRTPSD